MTPRHFVRRWRLAVGWHLLDWGRLDEAQAWLGRARKASPKDPEVLLALAAVYTAAARGVAPSGARASASRYSGLSLSEARVRPVSGLGTANFEVREDGVLQEIQSARWGEEPIEVVLALDTSGSVAGRRIERLKAAAGSLLAQLRRDDCVRILTLASGVRFAEGSCLDAGSAGAAIQGAVGMGGTRLHDGLYAALALAGGQKGLPTVVALTDGQDTSSWLSSKAVLLAAKALPATVHVVVAVDSRGFRFSTPDWHERRPVMDGDLTPVVRGGTPPFLERIASETGGRVFRMAEDDIETAFGRVLQEIRGRYVLRYEPKGVSRPGWHRLEVELKGARGDVLARRGYLAATSAPPTS